MIVTCNLARDEIGDTLVDTVDLISNARRAGDDPAFVKLEWQWSRYNGGRYETMVRIAGSEPRLYLSKTWQSALRCHRFWVRYADERRTNVIGPATYQAM